jgi:hypothetical protein
MQGAQNIVLTGQHEEHQHEKGKPEQRHQQKAFGLSRRLEKMKVKKMHDEKKHKRENCCYDDLEHRLSFSSIRRVVYRKTMGRAQYWLHWLVSRRSPIIIARSMRTTGGA